MLGGDIRISISSKMDIAPGAVNHRNDAVGSNNVDISCL